MSRTAADITGPSQLLRPDVPCNYPHLLRILRRNTATPTPRRRRQSAPDDHRERPKSHPRPHISASLSPECHLERRTSPDSPMSTCHPSPYGCKQNPIQLPGGSTPRSPLISTSPTTQGHKACATSPSPRHRPTHPDQSTSL